METEMRKLVFCFDLENTLIDSWHSNTPLPSKIEHINRILQDSTDSIVHSYECFHYGIFSFAIDHKREKDQAIQMAQDVLFKDINSKFVPCFDELMQLCRFDTDTLQKWEIVQLMGKDLIFPMWTLQFPEYDFWLFDDALPQGRIQLIRTIDKQNTQTITMWRV